MRYLKMLRANGLHSAWQSLLRRWQTRRQQPAQQAPAGLFEASEGSANPAKEDFCRVMNELSSRGVSVMHLYTGSILDKYSYKRQFAHVFGNERFFADMLVEYRPDIDHSLTSQDVQAELLALLRPWVTRLSMGR